MANFTIEHLRQIEWGSSHTWEILFPDNPIPGFDSWISASEVERDIFNMDTYTIDSGLVPVVLPERLNEFRISITFVDDIYRHVEQWLEHWVIVDMFNKGVGLSYIKDYARKIQIRLLDKQHNVVRSYNDYVIPSGNEKMKGTNKAELIQPKLDLIIVSDFLEIV